MACLRIAMTVGVAGNALANFLEVAGEQPRMMISQGQFRREVWNHQGGHNGARGGDRAVEGEPGVPLWG